MSAISGAVLFWQQLSYGCWVAQFHHCHLRYDLWIWNEKRRLPNKKMRHRLSRFGLCPHSKISFHSCNSDQIFVFRNNFAQILATETTHPRLIIFSVFVFYRSKWKTLECARRPTHVYHFEFPGVRSWERIFFPTDLFRSICLFHIVLIVAIQCDGECTPFTERVPDWTSRAFEEAL